MVSGKEDHEGAGDMLSLVSDSLNLCLGHPHGHPVLAHFTAGGEPCYGLNCIPCDGIGG